MASSTFRLGEADLNALIRLVFETPKRSRRVYAREGAELQYLERNGRGGPRLGACTVDEFRAWCSRKRVRTRPATQAETARDWQIIWGDPQ